MQTQTLDYKLEFNIDPEADKSWASGQLLLTINGRDIWFPCDCDVVPVDWNLTPFLKFLGDNWQSLLYDESYPLNLNSSSMLEFRDQIERRWKVPTNEAQLDNEEDVVYRFESNCNLASGFNGIFLPAVFLKRKGCFVQVCNDETNDCTLIPFQNALTVLESLGNEIAEYIKEQEHPYVKVALSSWNQRKVGTV